MDIRVCIHGYFVDIFWIICEYFADIFLDIWWIFCNIQQFFET